MQCVKTKNMFIERLPPHALSVAIHVTTPALFVCLSRLPLNARRFQRKHPLNGMGSSLNVSKGIGMGVTDPVNDAV